MPAPGATLHRSRITSNAVAFASRSGAENVTVLSETVPAGAQATGTLNSIVTMAPVDGHGMVVPPCDERMLSKAAGSCIVRTGQVREGRADGTCSHHDIAYGLGEMLLQPSHDVELIGCVPFLLRTNGFNCVNQYV